MVVVLVQVLVLLLLTASLADLAVAVEERVRLEPEALAIPQIHHRRKETTVELERFQA